MFTNFEVYERVIGTFRYWNGGNGTGYPVIVIINYLSIANIVRITYTNVIMIQSYHKVTIMIFIWNNITLPNLTTNGQTNI